MHECANISGLHVAVLVGRLCKCETFHHEAFVVPLVKNSSGFLNTILGVLSVVESVYIELFVSDVRVDHRLDEKSCSPADIC